MLPTDYECLMACKLVTLLQGTPWSRQEDAALEGQTSTLIETREVDHFMEEFRKMDWRLVTTSERVKIDASGEHGYMGACFVNDEKKLILIAHRGTQFVEAGNVVACLAILQKSIPEMLLKCAMSFVAHAHAFNQDKGHTIVQTGFSLGGFLAEAAGACSAHHWQETPYSHHHVICFDSPGADTALQLLAAQAGEYQGMASNKQNTIIYVAFPNVVNTANPHHGEVRQIKSYCGQRPSKIDLQVKQGVTLNFADDGFKTESVLLDTMRTHNQDTLRKLLLSVTPYFDYVQVVAWPLASNQLVMEDFSAAPGMLPLRSKAEAGVPHVRTYDAYQELKTGLVGRFAFHITFDDQKQQGAVGIVHKVDRATIQYMTSPVAAQSGTTKQSELLARVGKTFPSREETLQRVGDTLQRKEVSPGCAPK